MKLGQKLEVPVLKDKLLLVVLQNEVVDLVGPRQHLSVLGAAFEVKLEVDSGEPIELFDAVRHQH